MKVIFYNPILWFFLMPAIVVPIVNTFVSFEPNAFANTVISQRILESQIKDVQQQINQLQEYSLSVEQQTQLSDLQFKLQKYKNELQYYKSSRKVYLNNAYFPFYVLLIVAVIFLVLAVTWKLKVPLFLRYGSIATGIILMCIFIAQYITVVMNILNIQT